MKDFVKKVYGDIASQEEKKARCCGSKNADVSEKAKINKTVVSIKVSAKK